MAIADQRGSAQGGEAGPPLTGGGRQHIQVTGQLHGRGLTYVHAYDDPAIIAGHGTVGVELAADAPDVTDVLVSIGGGALSSGVAVALKAANPAVRVWGWRPRVPTP